jgi:hypothetical protein
MNNFERYYTEQAGNGIAGFSGVKYQKGFGFFGRLLSGAVLPFLKFLGKNALSTGTSIAQDITDTDDFSLKNIKDVSTRRLKETGKKILKRAADKILTGEGVRKPKRRKIMKKKKPIKKAIRKRSYKRGKKVYKKQKPRKRRILKATDFL